MEARFKSPESEARWREMLAAKIEDGRQRRAREISVSRRPAYDKYRDIPDDHYAWMIRRLVEGQVRSFFNAHPEIAERALPVPPVAGKTKAESLTDSISKRVIRELTCPQSRDRIKAALMEPAAVSERRGGFAARLTGTLASFLQWVWKRVTAPTKIKA